MNPDNIITFAYDDIADNSRNPFPGQVFNQPDGDDVYAGVNIDYKGRDVTPANFLAVLTGDADSVAGAGNGKVLKSNSKSKVFINFSDHGAPGLIAFPSKYLYANDLQSAFETMNSKNMYKEVVFYLEACESGSMFENILPDNINIYATTAANAHESSWGNYCSPNDKVQGVSLRTCLGDLYSNVWMEDTEAEDIATETLEEQFELVKKETAKSHVMEYGQKSFSGSPIGDFLGTLDDDNTAFLPRQERKLKKKVRAENAHKVDSRDIKLAHLYAMVMDDASNGAHIELMEEINSRMRADNFFEKFAADQTVSIGENGEEFPLPTKFACLKALIDEYEESCEKLTDYSLKYVKYFVRECENYPDTFSMELSYKKIREGCQ